MNPLKLRKMIQFLIKFMRKNGSFYSIIPTPVHNGTGSYIALLVITPGLSDLVKDDVEMSDTRMIIAVFSTPSPFQGEQEEVY